MACQFTTQRRVAFSEVDSAGIVHFANYPRFAEDAEHAFFRSLGLSIVTRLKDGRSVGWPRVRTCWDYLSPMRFEDEVEIHLLVREMGEKSITYAFELRVSDGSESRLCARGTTTAVCVTGVDEGRIRSVPIPAEVRDRIEQAPPELLAQHPED